jgi:hypothetical protein
VLSQASLERCAVTSARELCYNKRAANRHLLTESKEARGIKREQGSESIKSLEHTPHNNNNLARGHRHTWKARKRQRHHLPPHVLRAYPPPLPPRCKCSACGDAARAYGTTSASVCDAARPLTATALAKHTQLLVHSCSCTLAKHTQLLVHTS